MTILNTVVSVKKGASADSTMELPIQTSTSGNNISLFDGDYTATLSSASSGQTIGFKNDVFIVKDQNDSDSVVISKTETFPSGNFKSAVMSSTGVYLDDTKSSIVGTVDDEGFNVTYSASTSSSDGSVTVSDGYHYNNETDAPFYLGSSLTQTASQMVVHSEDFVEQTGPGSANYEIVGSAVTVDSNHVASGFTTSSYLKIPFGYDPATNSPSFEMVVHIKTPSNVDNGEGIGLQVMDGIANQWWLRFGVNSSTIFLKLNGSAGGSGSYTVSGNTEYYIKVSVTNSAVLSISTDGTNYTNVLTLSSTKFSSASGVVDYFYLGYNRADPVFTGSIYLDDCYIKFNGATVWTAYSLSTYKQGTLFLKKPTATSTSSVIIANGISQPVNNYTVVGSPTITNGVASGFSNSNYLTLSNCVKDASSSFEIVTAVNRNNPSLTGYNYSIFDCATRSSISIYLGSAYKLLFWVSSNGGLLSDVAEITGTTTLSVGTKYYVKATYDSSTGYALYLSTDGSTWTLEGTSSSTTLPYSTDPGDLLIGRHRYMTQGYFPGSIYLNDTYIMVDGELAWQAITPSHPIGPVDTSKEYCGSVVDPLNKGKVVTMDTTLTKILSVGDSA